MTPWNFPAAVRVVLLLALAAAGCREKTETGRAAPERTVPAPLASSEPHGAAGTGSGAARGEPQPAAAGFSPGDAERGKQLIETFECNRCHDVTGHKPIQQTQHCVQCHDDISKGKFPAPASAVARWKKTVDPYTVAPSLHNLGERLGATWLYEFLLFPKDLRPHLDASMPRLALSDEQARDLVTYLTAQAVASAAEPPAGNLVRGRELVNQKGCGSCHEFSGAPALEHRPALIQVDEQQKRASRLAPDLAFTRQRFVRQSLVRWLLDPKAMKPDTLMPSHGLNEKEAADVAAYLFDVELKPVAPKPVPVRLPVLERRVSYEEVYTRVFGVTCRHCHGDPDVALGDGGPGNTGGFGFKPKGLDLATYRGVSAGYLDAQQERQSVFLPLSDGTPRLLAVLLARQGEESGQRHSEVRGMPLGLPALDAEQVQLVESWIAQGRPK